MIAANTYETLENDVVSRLAPLAEAGCEVVPLADTDAEYTEAFEKPRISVLYKSSEFSPSVVRGLPEMVTTSSAGQDEYADVILSIQARTRRGENGVFDASNRAKKLLLGFVPTHFGRLFLKDFSFVAQDKGVWTYEMTFTCKGMVIQGFDDGETGPNLVQVTTNINPNGGN